MTAIRIKTEPKTILDFSNTKVSRNYVINKLKTANFLEFKVNDKNLRTYLEYNIKIGIYTIFIGLLQTQSCAQRLKEYKRFYINIYEGNKEIDLHKDSRFSLEPWVAINNKLGLKTYHLASAIVFCNRLHNLKTFL